MHARLLTRAANWDALTRTFIWLRAVDIRVGLYTTIHHTNITRRLFLASGLTTDAFVANLGSYWIYSAYGSSWQPWLWSVSGRAINDRLGAVLAGPDIPGRMAGHQDSSCVLWPWRGTRSQTAHLYANVVHRFDSCANKYGIVFLSGLPRGHVRLPILCHLAFSQHDNSSNEIKFFHPERITFYRIRVFLLDWVLPRFGAEISISW